MRALTKTRARWFAVGFTTCVCTLVLDELLNVHRYEQTRPSTRETTSC